MRPDTRANTAADAFHRAERSVLNSNAQPDKRSYRVDFSRYAALAPDHQPQLSLSESIERLVEGLRAIDFNDPEFRTSGLARLPVLRGFVDAARLGPELRWGRASH